jgi:organic radical activating enzyme
LIIEIFANLCMSMVSFMKGDPTEEKIERNIKELQAREWFRELYTQNERFIQTDENIRHIIGTVKVEKVVQNEKKEERLKGDIIEALAGQPV